jgi:hypothetical protein
MTTLYWVASAPANLASANWATSSGGSATNTPTTGDFLVLDGFSSQTCTVSAAISLLGLDCNQAANVNGPFAGTLQHNGFTITITGTGAGAFRLSSGMTYAKASVSSIVAFTNTSGTANLTSAGKSFAAITINAPGGIVQQQDNLSVDAVTGAILTLTAGTFDSNNANSYTLTACIFNFGTGTATRTYLGAGTITVGGNIASATAILGSASGTGLTFTLNSANMIVLAPSSQIFSFNFTPPAVTFNNLTFNNNTRNCSIFFSISTSTIATLTFGSGYYVQAGGTVTCSSFALNGTAANPCFYGGNAIASAVVLSCSGTATATWSAIYNCTGTVGTFTATNSFALGATTGWSITSPIALTAATVATAVWQDLLASGDFGTAGSIGAFLKAIGNLQFTVPAMARGTVGAGSTTTSIATSAFDPPGAVANQFANGVVVFDKTTATAALRSQKAMITASSNAGAPTLTVGALTTAPASGDTFSVV